MDNALVSVIIPVYNVSEYIERSVNSLLNQTCQNIEIILINDGSTDNSGEVCRTLRDKYPEKIVFIEQKNSGVSAARNAGLDIARGEYIVFVDADDWVSEDYVEKLYSALIANNADMATCGFFFWYSEENQQKSIRPNPGSYTKEEFYKTMLLRQVPLWATIYKSSIIKQNQVRFDTLLRRMEDGCFVADYTACCETFIVIPEYLYFYYQREGSAMNSVHKSTLLGVERSAYIYNKLENTYNRSGVDKSIYEHQFTSKWVSFIPNTAVGIIQKHNKLTRKEKIDFIKQSIVVSDIKHKLNTREISKCSLLEKTLVRWTMKERIGLILLYAHTFNFLRKIKRILKG